MPNLELTITIPEASVTRVVTALCQYAELPATGTAEERRLNAKKGLAQFIRTNTRAQEIAAARAKQEAESAPPEGLA